ncbi:lipocalin-like domain-containing protein [Bradyrhizobium sp. INPA03-11B]|uniref:lipocalin-like domain-containing protein n=1 Tax=Bradyrhizobium sp. INPA03-11B TaxID=418598 RepID=UPI00338F77E1
MLRTLRIGLSLFLFVTPSQADDKDRLLGTWKLVSAVHEDVATKQRKQVYGEHPNGYIAFTPDERAFVILTADGRKVPQTEQERAAALISMSAYTGKYRLEGDKFITKVDVASNEAWRGTDQIRFYRIDDNTLYIETAPFSAPTFGGSMVRGILAWERAN